MWKWLGGCLLVCVAVIGMGIWAAYRKLAPYSGANDTETVVIAAPVPRVFASLGNADSLSGWMADRLGVRVSHHGMLVTGDTLEMGARRVVLGARTLKWTVADVKPNQLLLLQLSSDSTGKLVARREFTLAARGDSTVLTSAVAAPLLDSIQAKGRDTIRASDALLAGASKLFISSMRMQSHIELQQLKARVEGHPAPAGSR